MMSSRNDQKIINQQILGFVLFAGFFLAQARFHNYTFIVRETEYTRLCSSKKILTVNGQFPGPTIHALKGDTLIIHIRNRGKENITIHWHGVKQPRSPWSDGPEYITQCPIQPGANFRQQIVLSDEDGTLWWHAHSDWSRATVHGVIAIYPREGSAYPFTNPHSHIPIVLGEWWKSDVQDVLNEFVRTGGGPNVSDALTINGQPGDLYPCSRSGTFNVTVEYGKKYLLRLVNAAMNTVMFFAIANHNLTVVGSDASYTKPLKSDYITISPGQSMDVLLEANQRPDRYYMAAMVHNSAIVDLNNGTTTAILVYKGNYIPSSPTPFPSLPKYNDTNASVSFTGQLRSLGSVNHPVPVPLNITTKLLFTLSINTFPCVNGSCGGPNGTRLAASVNNISFQNPTISILDAYYGMINGTYGDQFPSFPPSEFNYTGDYIPVEFQTPRKATEVIVLEYNSTVELVFQGTNLFLGVDHPMHLHGQSFYVVGWGFGNFDKEKDPLNYNLVDPPLQNTIAVPRNGWTAIRFRANNPGVWFMHCHFERHTTWGMEMAFIVKDGNTPDAKMMPRPSDMPPCSSRKAHQDM